MVTNSIIDIDSKTDKDFISGADLKMITISKIGQDFRNSSRYVLVHTHIEGLM